MTSRTVADGVCSRATSKTDSPPRPRRSAASPSAALPYLPVLATDAATKPFIDACVREGLGVIDRRGTLVLHGGPVYVHVEGHAPIERVSRVRLFSGKACRVLRALLAQPERRFKAQDVASGTQTSYAFAYDVLAKLEKDGYLTRSSPRAGFRVRDAVGLLKAWISSGERTAVRAIPYFAPNTRPEALEAAEAAARVSGVKAIFSLASALLPGEAFVSGLPHGAYVSGDVTPIETALRLERTTPHNFLVLRADAASDTAAGGIHAFTRRLPHGTGVALPQLASDFATVGGRGREQADRLVELYARALPAPEVDE